MAMKDQLAKGACSILRELETPTPETFLGEGFERVSGSDENGSDELDGRTIRNYAVEGQ